MNRQPKSHHSTADRDDETTLVITFLSLIDGGFSEGQAALAETAARQCGVPVRYALYVLRQYTGPNYRDHYWQVRKGSCGRRSYQLLKPNCSMMETLTSSASHSADCSLIGTAL